MADKTIFPMIPESNWWKLRDQFKKTMPPTVNNVYIKSLLSLATTNAASNIIRPLKQLKLIDEEGKPTQRAIEWRNDAKYADICQQIIDEIYPEGLRSLYSGKDIDKAACKEWFLNATTLGASAASSSAAMYILLNDKTPKSSAEFSKPKKVTTKVTTPKSMVSPIIETKNKDVVDTETKDDKAEISQSIPNVTTPVSTTSSGKQLSLHIDLQIHISADASSEQIDQIFASMAKHIPALSRSE
jgi:hypothetical protein